MVSTVLRVRCYLHLRWYYSNLMFNAFRIIFISILVFGSLVFWHWKVFIQSFLGFLYKSAHALEIIKAVKSVHHAIACKYKIPSEHLGIFVGEHHLASLCGFTRSTFHLHSWTPLLLVPGFQQFPISIIIVPIKLVKLINMNITRWPWWRTPPSKMCSSRLHPFQSSRESGRQSSSGRSHILVLKLFYNGFQW